MAFDPINNTQIEVGKPVKKEILDKIQGNFDNHETRISNVELATGKFVIFSGVIDVSANRVGEIKHFLISDGSMVNQLNGPDWVTRIDGSSLVGKDLNNIYTKSNSLPNFKTSSRFLRYSDTTGYIGTEQASANKTHTHILQYEQAPNGYTNNELHGHDPFPKDFDNTLTSPGPWVNVNPAYSRITPQGEFEARPDNCAVRMGIRVNDRPLTYIQVSQAPANLNIVNCTISNLEAGIAGNLTVDIKKGAALNSIASILSAPLTLPYSAGDYATSSQASFSTSSLLQNDFITLDITSLQSQQTRFAISCYAEVV